MSDSSALRHWLIVATAVIGCISERPPHAATPIQAPSAVRPAAAPEAAAPAPCVSEPRASPADAEQLLRERLSTPSVLYSQTVDRNGLRCEPETFTPVDGDSFSRGAFPRTVQLLQAGAMVEQSFVLSYAGIHGYSADSVLANGSEWFFSQAACLGHVGRYPPSAVKTIAADGTRSNLLRLILDPGRRLLKGPGASVVEFVPQGWEFLINAGNGTTYRGMFYSTALLAWLAGPVESSSRGERFAGVYRVTIGEDFFEIGGLPFFEASGVDVPRASTPLPRPSGALVEGDGERCGIANFADEFWRHDARYFLPLRDYSGVSCQEIRFDANGMIHYTAFGKQYQVSVSRTQDGFVCGIKHPVEGLVEVSDTIPGGTIHHVTVHGRGPDSFMLSGSPWFFTEEACKARGADAKPVNFRDFPSGPLNLAREYYALRSVPKGCACEKLELFDVNEPSSRLVETGPAGRVQRQFDVYGEGGLTFWFGPPLTPSLPVEARYHGELVTPRRVPGGLRVGDDVWYESEAVCQAHARTGACKVRAASDAGGARGVR